MADVELSHETLARFDFDPHRVQYPYSSRTPWSLPMDQTSSRAPSQRMANVKRSTSPIQGFSQAYDQIIDHHSRTLMPDWQMPTTSGPQMAYALNTTFPQQQYSDGFAMSFQTSPTEFIQNQSDINAGLSMENSYFPILNTGTTTAWDSQAMQPDLLDYPLTTAGMADMNFQRPNFPDNSPTDVFSDNRSLTSSSSDNGWHSVERRQPSLESSYHDGQNGGALFNPGQIHEPTLSESSFSELEFPSHIPWTYVEVPSMDQLSSPGSDRDYQHIYTYPYGHAPEQDEERDPSSSPVIITSSTVQPIPIKVATPTQRSPTSTGRSSPPGRRASRKAPKTTKPTIRRPSQAPKLETEKKVGRRKGPLRPEQRKQACEIRKLGACLRCRFLKKTVCRFPPRKSDTILMKVV